MKKIKKYFLVVIISIILSFVLMSSVIQLYKDRGLILTKLGFEYDYWGLETPNKTYLSEKQLPQLDHKKLILTGDENKKGLWSAPFDWSVIGIHSVLLPDGKVLSFGSYAGKNLFDENDNIKANKEITLSDGFKLDRDGGDIQWQRHNVQAGVDMDIWDPKLGIGQDSHKTFHRSLNWDAFCSVVRVMNFDEVFILGGNKEPKIDGPDTQNATVIFNLKNEEFKKYANLNYERWYGSIVRLKDDRLLMLGGSDISVDEDQLKKKHTKTKEGQDHHAEVGGGYVASTTPEILNKNINGIYEWKVLNHLKSHKFFGNHLSDEWSYPKSFLLSDGSVVGISYNKIWRIDNDLKKIEQVGEIPLKKNGYMKQILERVQPNKRNDERTKKIIVGTMGSGVGSTSSALMIREDKIILIGGHQVDGDFLPSNEVHLIDFSNDYKNPKIKQLTGMNFPRSNLNATILPNGNIFDNGGHAYKDREFSVFEGEIYDYDKNEWDIVSSAHMRRNYHGSSLLLTDGSILVAGGDVWNAEIFYPPYLFNKNEKFETVVAERLKIKPITEKKINKSNFDNFEIDIIGNSENLAKLTMLSTGSVTHAQTTESRFYELQFEKDFDIEGKIKVNLSNLKDKIQNGMYIIFALDTSGIPSEGEIIQISQN